VLARRAMLESGAAAGIALSVFLHVAAAAIHVYAAMHQTAPAAMNVVNITLAPMTAPPVPAKTIAAPVIHEPAPVVEQAKPIAKPEPKTVPMSPFGKSPKKGSEAPAPAPPAPAAAAVPVAPAVPIGGTGVAIEGDFPYTIYVQNMNRLIGQHWSRPDVKGGTSTVIHFVIDRDGTIRDVVIEAPSGNALYDRAAQRAVMETSPLPPLPFAYNGTFLGVRLIFK
jgi:protein TonB